VSDARRTEQQQRVAIGDEAPGAEVPDLRAVERGLAVKPKPAMSRTNGNFASPKLMSMRRWSFRAISRSQRNASASRSVNSERTASSRRLSS